MSVVFEHLIRLRIIQSLSVSLSVCLTALILGLFGLRTIPIFGIFLEDTSVSLNIQRRALRDDRYAVIRIRPYLRARAF